MSSNRAWRSYSTEWTATASSRLPDPDDKRSRLSRLTELASRRMLKGKAIMGATVQIALQGISAADIERLGQIMRRINENLERAAEEAQC